MESPSCFESDNIQEAIETWKAGGLVAIPTETVYGLGAPINRVDLVKKIFSYKERPLYDPLIVHVFDIEQAKKCTNHWSSLAQKLAEEFWPGPLTIVLPKSEQVDPLITSGLKTVGIRCPKNLKTLELLKKIGVGVAAPSANKFTKTSPTKKEHVLDSFKEDYLCVLTSDETCEVGIESSIVRILDDQTLEILRPGIITSEDLKKACPNVNLKEGVTAREEKEKVSAPGQDKIHYRPDYPLFYSFENLNHLNDGEDKETEVLNLDSDPYVAARSLYLEMLRPLTIGKKRRVLVFPENYKNQTKKELEVWDSLLNRLEKAATLWK